MLFPTNVSNLKPPKNPFLISNMAQTNGMDL